MSDAVKSNQPRSNVVDLILERIDDAHRQKSTILNLSQLSLTEVPEIVRSLVDFEGLVLTRNRLTSLPPWIGELTHLRHLSLGRNQLISLPDSLGELCQLETLTIGKNKLERLPAAIGRLHNLSELTIGTNPLIDPTLPVSDLVNLKILKIVSSKVTLLPGTLYRLQHLETLEIQDAQLTSVPETLDNLTKLKSLNLSYNKLRTIISSIDKLHLLRSLDLSHNQLSSIPSALWNLRELEILHLNHNKIGSLPEQIGGLRKLIRLNLQANSLVDLPKTIGQLTRLEALNVHTNQLRTLPPTIGNLCELKSLNLRRNKIDELPDSIGHLEQLHTLGLGRNKLVSLPSSMLRLTGLFSLTLQGNSDLGIPPEILSSSPNQDHGKPGSKPADILRYYFRMREEPKRELNEAKILVVGQGGVGKTSLIKRVISDLYDPDELKTEGIDITQWELLADSQKEASIRLNIWDFGGQEIMHATHQFFLTKRSLYLVVLDARKGENESNIHYWLKIIQSYGGNAPVIVVTNKSEPPNRLELNETRLRLDYAPNLRGFARVSCATGEGIADLRNTIKSEVRALPHIHDSLPLSFFEVKKAIEAKTENFINYNEFEELCKTHRVVDQRDQSVLIRFLHDLGSILNFHDPESPYQLQDTNILNPEWVTGGVYKILNSNLLMQRQGRLDTNELPHILNDVTAYPPEKYKFLLDMMRKFELCFDFPDSRGRLLLVPELLSPNEPDLNWDSSTALNFQYHYNVLPSGVICRFIVKMHHNLTRNATYWRSGVVVEIDGNRALVRSDGQHGRVYISVQGPVAGRARCLSVIRDAFKAIHATMPKLKAEEKIPLPDNPNVAVDYLHLLRLEERNVETFLPEGSDKDYDVLTLVRGVEDKHRPKSRIGSVAEEDDQEGANNPDRRQLVKNPWLSGSFYLISLLALLLATTLSASYVGWYALGIVLIAALLGVVVVGILQLRNDERLRDASFVKLVTEFFARLPLLQRGGSARHTTSSSETGDQQGNDNN